jgi:hypothetical protein
MLSSKGRPHAFEASQFSRLRFGVDEPVRSCQPIAFNEAQGEISCIENGGSGLKANESERMVGTWRRCDAMQC